MIVRLILSWLALGARRLFANAISLHVINEIIPQQIQITIAQFFIQRWAWHARVEAQSHGTKIFGISWKIREERLSWLGIWAESKQIEASRKPRFPTFWGQEIGKQGEERKSGGTKIMRLHFSERGWSSSYEFEFFCRHSQSWLRKIERRNCFGLPFSNSNLCFLVSVFPPEQKLIA